MRNKIYFISDVHLGAPNPERSHREQEDVLIGFLRAIREDAEVLYIVGDLFDFWFEYRSVITATGARVIFELYALVQAGVRVVYLPGNHDLWPGSYFSDQVGMELPGDPVTATHQGKRLFLTHGDSFRMDWKFRLSRGVLKSPWSIRLFRLLHPDLGARLAEWTTRWSEYRASQKKNANKQMFRKGVLARVPTDYDYVVCGHYHRLQNRPLDAGQLIILGDWLRLDSYGVMADGEIVLKRWHADTGEGRPDEQAEGGAG